MYELGYDSDKKLCMHPSSLIPAQAGLVWERPVPLLGRDFGESSPAAPKLKSTSVISMEHNLT